MHRQRSGHRSPSRFPASFLARRQLIEELLREFGREPRKPPLRISALRRRRFRSIEDDGAFAVHQDTPIEIQIDGAG